MKTQIDIFTGFLSSGKTSAINGELKGYIEYEKKIVIIQCKAGEQEIHHKYIGDNILVKKLVKGKSLECIYLKEIIRKYSPDRIIIEQNGMNPLDELLNLLDNRDIRKYAIVNNIYNIIDCRQFNMLMGIIGSNLVNQIVYSDIILLNYTDKVLVGELKRIKKKVRTINKSGTIIDNKEPKDFVDCRKDKGKNSILQGKISENLSMLLLIAITIYFFFNVLKSIDFNMNFSKLYTLNTIFISILMESFPFLILGVFISSIIQIFVTRDMIVKYFPKSKILSFLVLL